MCILPLKHPEGMSRILPLFDKEAQMVKALRQGDPKAQRQLYDRYASRMLGVCIRYVGDHMTAEDVLVEGFMKVFDKIGQFKSEGSFEGWMRRIMVNESLGYLRQRKRIQEVDIIDEAQQVVDTSLADEALETEEMLQMIDTLPIGYRTVFNLYAIEGYTHAEIAEKLGITESTSKSQLHRARALLQQLVTDWENELKKKIEYEEA
ncbi:DNA-directed RNA polymerase sigma-70 factor [Persicitalea jodogahamensis]|uniref:DNA-directed RNA polymerase sigma-70 factor n=2 Tax=Persicitalea jodogahamensis TaxID=402147 RepID=A0A8J3D423_9BACT|nr:DNA-directed RNA polymerase sigma-70 factor [Persicitalea jodogahamensis]